MQNCYDDLPWEENTLALTETGSRSIARIVDRGHLLAGVSQGVPGLSTRAPDGEFKGFDVDLARALAMVLLGSTDAVAFEQLASGDRFAAVEEGRVDVGVYNASCTLQRELKGVHFPIIALYDGEAALVPRRSGIETLKALKRPTIAVVAETTTASNLAAYFGCRPYRLVAAPNLDRATAIYEAGEADAIVFDATALAGVRARLSDPDEHILMVERLSKEPLGPVVADDDPIFARIVVWTVRALILAEEFGITTENIGTHEPGSRAEAFLRSGLPIAPGDPFAVARLEGLIRRIGSYADLFERNLGAQSGLALQRGHNRLWTEGGLLYAPSIG